jgi:DUF4097 and DUF4098 domain-containing protein YvlB
MKIALLMLLSLAIAAPLAADDCRHTAPRQLTEPSDGIRVVEIRAAAGSLLVEGVGGATVRASGTACSSSEDDLDGIRLESNRRGDRLIVEAVMPDTRSWSFGWNVQRRLDFTVALPSNLSVEIDDGSGSIEVRNVAAVEIEDGSGPIDIRGVRGAVRIDDGSGDITIRDAGPIHITDGSGDIDIQSVRGDVIIEDDGSGGIEIADVTGNVVVENDGSGSIAVRNISGDFTVRHDGSGGVSVHGVRGRVSVPK